MILEPAEEDVVASFTTTLVLSGNNVGIVVPDDVVESCGAGKQVPVMVTIAGYSYPSTFAVMGGQYPVGAVAVHREAAGVAGGETHEITLTHGTSARDTRVPDDLAEALDAAGLRATFDALAPSHRKEHMRSVTEAKTEATRQRRIEKVVSALG